MPYIFLALDIESEHIWSHLLLVSEIIRYHLFLLKWRPLKWTQYATWIRIWFLWWLYAIFHFILLPFLCRLAMYCFFNCYSVHWTVLLFFQMSFIWDSDISRAPSVFNVLMFHVKMLFLCNWFSFISSMMLFPIVFSVSRGCTKYLILTSFHVVNIILWIAFFPSLVRVLWEILQGRIFGLLLSCMCVALKLSLCRNTPPTGYFGAMIFFHQSWHQGSNFWLD